MSGSRLLRGVDRASFAVAFAGRLRAAGVPAGPTGAGDLVRALAASPPDTLPALYWTARVTLVRRHADLAVFDQVFTAVFGDPGVLARRLPQRGGATTGADRFASVPADDGPETEGGGLPWATLPAVVGEAADTASTLTLRERRPSAVEELADRPFQALEPDQLALLAGWLRACVRTWPTRRSRRRRVAGSGSRVALRPTLARARRTGWEPIEPVTVTPVRVPRRIVLLCDVSRSMQAQAAAYLHLTRALLDVADAEAFAFGTSLTRLTGALGAAAAAGRLPDELAADRFGGTRIASSLRTLLGSHHGHLLRGAVVVIGSDGWDSDPPAELAAAMARVHRRAYRVLWMNPRAGTPGFEPRVAAMAAALPYCDALLPAGTFRDLAGVVSAVSSTASRGSRGGNGSR